MPRHCYSTSVFKRIGLHLSLYLTLLFSFVASVQKLVNSIGTTISNNIDIFKYFIGEISIYSDYNDKLRPLNVIKQ